MKLEISGQGTQITPTNITVDVKPSTPDVKIEKQDNHKSTQSLSSLDTDTKMALDHATGLIQNITTNRITDEVIRKMPSDEYLHLLKLMDDIIAGSVNKKI